MTKSIERSAIEITKAYVQYLKKDYDQDLIEKLLKEHHAFPHLSSISDVLFECDIYNEVLNCRNKDLNKVVLPSILQLKNQESNHYVIVISCSSKCIKFFDATFRIRCEPYKTFFSKWDKFLIAPFEIKRSSSRWNILFLRFKQKKKVLFPIIPLLIFLVFSLFHIIEIADNYISQILLIFLLKALGMSMVFYLWVYQNSDSNVFISKLCLAKSTFNCSEVINSSASKIFGNFGLIEAGGVYFLGGIIALLFSQSYDSLKSVLYILSILNILTLSFTFFSVYYQAQILKKWCPICLGILLIFWLEFFLLVSFLVSGIKIPFMVVNSVILSFGIPLIVASQLLPIIKKTYQLRNSKVKLFKVLKNPIVFSSLYNKVRSFEIEEIPNEIVLGEASAKNTLVLVVDPFCPHCEDMLRIVEGLIRNKDSIKVYIRFFFNNDKSLPVSIVISKIIELNYFKGSSIALDALKNWYRSKGKGAIYWIVSLGFEAHSESLLVKDQIESYKTWNKKTFITGSPAILFNGRKVPLFYSPEQFIYHINRMST